MTTTPLPGIGIRYEFIAQDGYRIGVVHHRARAGRGRAGDRPAPAAGRRALPRSDDRDTGARTSPGVSIVAVRRRRPPRAGSRVRPVGRGHAGRRRHANRGSRSWRSCCVRAEGARRHLPARGRRGHPAARDPGAGRVGVRLLADPAVPACRVGVRAGGVVPLVTANRFIEAGAEIGLILLLFTLGFVDRRAATSAPA